MNNRPVEAPITEYLHRKASHLRIPLSGSFELTPVCNMSCRMCYVRMSRAEQEAIHPLHTAEEWLSLGQAAKDLGMLYLLLTGGEPFIRPDFRQIMEGLHRMGLLVSINTNATLIDRDTVDWLVTVPPARMNITLYGASDETYERLCGNPKGFTQAVNAIHMLKAAGLHLKIICSATPYNAHDLERIFAFCEQEKLAIQATSYMFPPLRRDSSMIGQNDRFSPEEAAEYSAKIEYFSNGRERFLQRAHSNELAGLGSDLEDNCSDTEGEAIRCRAGRCSFWVTWDGRLLPCGMLPGENAPNVFETGLEAAWRKAVEEADAIRLPAQCASCAIKDQCRACAAMVFTETGNFHTVPQYRCQMAHAYPDAVRRLASELEKK